MPTYDERDSSRTDSPAAKERARLLLAKKAAVQFMRDLDLLCGKGETDKEVNLADSPSYRDAELSLQIEQAVEAAGIDYSQEMRKLSNDGAPTWRSKADFYLAKMIRNIPESLRERVCETIRGDDDQDHNVKQCVEWATNFFEGHGTLTGMANMATVLLDFAYVRQGIDDEYIDQIALKHDKAYDQKALAPAGKSEIETEIQFEPMTDTPEGRAQVSTEIQQLQNIWDTAPDVSEFFSTIGSQKVTGTYEGRPILDYLTPEGINVRDSGNGQWQVNVPSVWGKQRWQTVGSREDAIKFGERVLREHKESKALVGPTPSQLTIERLKNATFDEGEPIQVAGQDPRNEPHVNAVMRVADTAEEVAALMARKTQAGMGAKIKWGGMALCVALLLVTGNPVYLAFLGVAYVMGYALIDKKGIERNTKAIDADLDEQKKLKEATSADRWFDDI